MSASLTTSINPPLLNFTPNAGRIGKSPTELLELFVQKAACSFGISDKVTLFLDNNPDTFIRCNPLSNSIHVSKNLIQNYGSGDNFLDQVIDLLPNNPYLLVDFLNRMTPTSLELLKKGFSIDSSTLEIEAALLHELGHIVCKHASPASASLQEKHHCEFVADVFAYCTDRGRLGFTRFQKRRIISSFLLMGKTQYNNFRIINSFILNPTHPHDEERLKMAFLFQNLFVQTNSIK